MRVGASALGGLKVLALRPDLAVGFAGKGFGWYQDWVEKIAEEAQYLDIRDLIRWHGARLRQGGDGSERRPPARRPHSGPADEGPNPVVPARTLRATTAVDGLLTALPAFLVPPREVVRHVRLYDFQSLR